MKKFKLLFGMLGFLLLLVICPSQSHAQSEKNLDLSIGFGNSFGNFGFDRSPGFLLAYEQEGLIGSRFFSEIVDVNRFFRSGYYINYIKISDDVNGSPLVGFGIRISADLATIVEEVSSNSLDLEKIKIYPGIQWGFTFYDSSYYWYNGYTGYGRLRPSLYITGKYFLTENLGAKIELGRTAFTPINFGLSFQF